MRSLPLYSSLPVAPIESVPGLDVNHGCKLCVLSEQPGLKTVCCAPEGDSGGLLVLGESPGREEDRSGRPFIGQSGKFLRALLAQHWKGPIAIHNSIACCPGATIDKDRLQKPVEACRPYVAQTLREVRPTRIVTLGSWAAYSLLGRAISMFGLRRSYSYLYGVDQSVDVANRFGVGHAEHFTHVARPKPVPVFPVIHPAAALRNRFVRQWFEQDLEWALTCADPPEPPVRGTCLVVESEQDARQAIQILKRFNRVSLDIEAAGIMYDPSYRVLCCAFAPIGNEGVEAVSYVFGKEALADPDALRVLADYLGDERYAKTIYNTKYDAQGLRLAGAVVRGIKFDPRLARKLIEPESSGYLEDVAELVGMGGHKEEAEAAIHEADKPIKQSLGAEKRCAKYDAWLSAPEGTKAPPKPSKATREALQYILDLKARDPLLESVIRKDPSGTKRYIYALIPDDVLYVYCARDSISSARLDWLLEPQIQAEPAFQHIWSEIVMPAARAIEHLERWGVPVDRGSVERFDAYLAMKLIPIAEQITQYAGRDFNPASTPHVRELLFTKLGLKPVGYTATELESTDADALGVLAGEHPVATAIVEWRRLMKLRSTYAGGMLDCLRADGRVHPSILLDGTRTGRQSCSDPNLYNAPRAKGSEEAKMFRDCFIASPGMVLIEVDLSQVELRVAAMLSQDPDMIAIFKAGIDFHTRTAQIVSRTAWKVEPEAVTEEMRSIAKQLNFGTLYSMGADELGRRCNITPAEAKKVQDAILGKFRRLKAWIAERLTYARKHGCSWSEWNGRPARRRPLYGVGDQDDARRVKVEHSAHNTPIQATATEFNTAAMIDTVDWILSEGIEQYCKLMLAIYDSLLLEVRESMAEEVAWQVKRFMLSRDTQGVPFDADVKVGRSWGSMLPLKVEV